VGQGKNTSVKKNGQSMNPFCFFYYQQHSTFPFCPVVLNVLIYSDSGSATSLSSSTGLMGPCFSMNGVSGSATMVPKVDAATSSAIAAPLVASDVKPSQPVSNSATKMIMSSKSTAKVSSFDIGL
jgi:hypothetical protein